jgi:hypothetical protein
MAKATVTRAALRQSICRELGNPFHKRFNTNSALTAVTDASTLVDTALTQKDNFWRNGWLLMTSGTYSGEVRRLSAFTAQNDTMLLERPLSGAPSAGDTYEMFNLWNSYQIHDAINRSIIDSQPSFFDMVTDETLVLEEDKLTYDVSGLTKSVYLITKIWLERSTKQKQMGVTASANGTVTVDGDITDVTSDWKISTYDGTGSGQLRSVSSVSGQIVTLTADWTTNPDTTTKVNLWNPTVQEVDWYRLVAMRFDDKRFTSKIYLPHLYRGSYGLRLRIEYLAFPSELTADTDTCIIPQPYLLHSSLAKLYNAQIDNNRADRRMFDDAMQRNLELAERYRKLHAFRLPEITMWQSQDEGRPWFGTNDNPMGW